MDKHDGRPLIQPCQDCTTAKTNPTWGGYRASCWGCKARMLAHSHAYFESITQRAKTPEYEAALQRVFAERAQAGNRLVRMWRKRLKKGTR